MSAYNRHEQSFTSETIAVLTLQPCYLRKLSGARGGGGAPETEKIAVTLNIDEKCSG